MRKSTRSKPNWLVVFVCLVVFVATLALVFLDGRVFSGEQNQVTSKGDVLTLLKTRFGPYEHFEPPSIKRWLIHHAPLPQKTKSQLAIDMGSVIQYWETGDFEKDALWFWVSLKQTATSSESMIKYYMEIVDENGWVYPDTFYTSFLWQNIVPNMAVRAFQNFPRHEENLNLKVYTQEGVYLGTFHVKNPLQFQRSNQENTAEPLPQSRNVGRADVSLEGVSVIESAIRPFISGGDTMAMNPIMPKLKWSYKNDSIEDWELVDMVLQDADGNLSTSQNSGTLKPAIAPLSPHQDFWNWRLSFVETSHPDPDSRFHQVWDSSEFIIPDMETVNELQQEHTLDSIDIRLVAVSSSGATVHSLSRVQEGNEYRIVSSESVETDVAEQWKIEYNPASQKTTVYSSAPHIALEINGISEDQRVSVFSKDQQGNLKMIPFHAGSSESNYDFSNLKSATLRNSKSNRPSHPQIYIPLDDSLAVAPISLRFVVHEVVHADFHFKPDPSWFDSGKN